MAKNILPTDYKDDLISESMNGKRRYRLINNPDGTISLEDVTEYEQLGSLYGAKQINSTNQAVNESFDKNKIVRDMDTIQVMTQEGYVPDALALKELNESLGMKTLWTNPEWEGTSNLSAFAPQTIQINNIGDYDMIGVCHSCYDKCRLETNFVLNIIDAEQVLNTIWYVDSINLASYMRKFRIVENGIYFSDGRAHRHDNVTKSNEYAIPVKVVGIKLN